MEIIVTYESEILGSGQFWKGDAQNIKEIRNIPARRLAELVAIDGKQRKVGMWTVSSLTP